MVVIEVNAILFFIYRSCLRMFIVGVVYSNHAAVCLFSQAEQDLMVNDIKAKLQVSL